MSTINIHTTGETFEATGPLLDYYQGIANTTGGLTIDGADYPAKVDVPAEDAPADEVYNPADHTVEEVQQYLAQATPEEQERVLDAERARGDKARVTLVGE